MVLKDVYILLFIPYFLPPYSMFDLVMRPRIR